MIYSPNISYDPILPLDRQPREHGLHGIHQDGAIVYDNHCSTSASGEMGRGKLISNKKKIPSFFFIYLFFFICSF